MSEELPCHEDRYRKALEAARRILKDCSERGWFPIGEVTAAEKICADALRADPDPTEELREQLLFLREELDVALAELARFVAK